VDNHKEFPFDVVYTATKAKKRYKLIQQPID